MLTFLRKIRKLLIDSGSIRKYLLYGVGEILLVMIGILLAMQVNNWNDEKKYSKTEVRILENLAKRFLSYEKLESHKPIPETNNM